MSLSASPCCVPDPNSPPKEPYVTRLSASSGDIIVEEFPVEFDGYTYTGHIAFRKDATSLPLVLVFPNYAGEKQFDVDTAVFLARLGYCGLSVDLYKSTASYPRSLRNPPLGCSLEDRQAHGIGAFTAMNDRLKNPRSWRALQTLYLSLARAHPAVHPRHAAAIGYCFGGQSVLEMVRNGDDIQGGVTFHGVLQSVPYAEPIDYATKVAQIDPSKAAANHYSRGCKVLIENGSLDHLVGPREMALFREEMAAEGMEYLFHEHGPAVDHGFALAPGVISHKYDAEADRRSTLSMLDLFSDLWPEHPPNLERASDGGGEPPRNACGTALTHWSSRL